MVPENCSNKLPNCWISDMDGCFFSLHSYFVVTECLVGIIQVIPSFFNCDFYHCNRFRKWVSFSLFFEDKPKYYIKQVIWNIIN